MTEAPSEHTDGRRARGAAARDAILTAATSLFSTRGYAATGISAIASRAGVKSGSIYHAFGSKEGLLNAVLQASADSVFADIESIALDDAAPPAERLRAAARILIGDPVFLRLFLLLALEKDGDPTVRASVEDVRSRARSVVVAAVRPALDTVPLDHRSAVADTIGRLTLVLLDGLFVSHQLDSEAADLEHTLTLVTTLTDLALTHLADLTP